MTQTTSRFFDEMARLMREGCELGVHGIDAWHSIDQGREELSRIGAVTGDPSPGIRMHWLLGDEHTIRVLEAAGYGYDSSVGYNEMPSIFSGDCVPAISAIVGRMSQWAQTWSLI